MRCTTAASVGFWGRFIQARIDMAGAAPVCIAYYMIKKLGMQTTKKTKHSHLQLVGVLEWNSDHRVRW
jgi:hypothetical protein